MTPQDRLIIALDRSSRRDILDFVEDLEGAASFFKVGLQAFVANGPSLVREIRQLGGRVFLDLKLHDIPNTVASAVREASLLDVDLLSIHAAGGSAMMKAAAQAVAGGSSAKLLAVTILTSLAAADIHEIGLQGSTDQNVVALSSLAARCGIHGVVASPLEATTLRDLFGAELVIVTPGIRSPGEAAGDQVRTMTPRQAIDAGADYIVVGRPITGHSSPRDAALRIIESMA